MSSKEKDLKGHSENTLLLHSTTPPFFIHTINAAVLDGHASNGNVAEVKGLHSIRPKSTVIKQGNVWRTSVTADIIQGVFEVKIKDAINAEATPPDALFHADLFFHRIKTNRTIPISGNVGFVRLENDEEDSRRVTKLSYLYVSDSGRKLSTSTRILHFMIPNGPEDFQAN